MAVQLQVRDINSLVKVTNLLMSDLTTRVKLSFKEINRDSKQPVMDHLRDLLKVSAESQTIRKKGHHLIAEGLVVKSAGYSEGGARGRSNYQVIVNGEPASLFARIYDTGGIIIPKRGMKYLAIPLPFGLQLGYKSPLDIPEGSKTVTVPLRRGGSPGGKDYSNELQLGGSGSVTGAKLIALKRDTFPPGKTKPVIKVEKLAGLFLLVRQQYVTPSHWLRDGTENFKRWVIPYFKMIGTQHMKQVVRRVKV